MELHEYDDSDLLALYHGYRDDIATFWDDDRRRGRWAMFGSWLSRAREDKMYEQMKMEFQNVESELKNRRLSV